MTINDVFRIAGRGTVVTGRLEGNVLLRKGPPADLLRDRTVTFQPGTAFPCSPPRRRRWFR